MKNLKNALIMSIVVTTVFFVCLFSECFNEAVKPIAPETTTNSSSRTESYLDSLEKREEVVMLDTLITHFGHHPGYLEYDTTYIVSYKTKSVSTANKLKDMLREARANH